MIQLGLCCPQTSFDIPQALPIGQLGKGHAAKLIPAGKTLDLVVAIVSPDTLTKIVNWDKVHQLRKYCTTSIHQPSPSARMQNYGLMKKIFSNRLYPLPPEKSLDLLIYSQLPDKRWDSSDTP